MFYIREIDYTTDPVDQSARFVRGLRAGVRKAIQYWKLRFVPRHFETGAVREYDYQLRTRKYQIRKARKMKHQKPLVWTGTLRAMVLAQFPQPRLSDTGGVIKGAMRLSVPPYIFYRTGKMTGQPPLYDELIRTNAAEVDAQHGVLMSEVNRSLARKMRKAVKTK